MSVTPVNGARLEIQRVGPPEGGPAEPLIFLHEGLGSVAMWRDWPAKLCEAARRPGYVYSRRGYGRSEGIPDVRGNGRHGPDYMHREAFETLPALLEVLGVPRPVLVGHSDGGSIALLHASRFPVTACIVMAPHVIVEDVSVASIAEAKRAYESGELRDRLARYHSDVDSAFWQWNDVWLSDEFRQFDIRHDCRRIEAPVLAIQGVDDPYGTLRQVEEIAPTRGRFELEVLAACGHSPHRDQPERTTARILQFLGSLGQAR